MSSILIDVLGSVNMLGPIEIFSMCDSAIHIVGNLMKWSTFYAPPCRSNRFP